jgi:hypothetical protein
MQQQTNELDTTALEIAAQPQVSMVRLFLAFLGDIIAFIGLIVTTITVWQLIISAPNPFLKFLVGVLACGPWLAVMAFCTAKIIQYLGLRGREKRVLSYVDVLIENKRDENKRANEAHAVELHLRQTRLAADERGNRDYVYDPATMRVIPVEGGNFIQPVPHSIHYSVKNDGAAIAGAGLVPALPAGKVQPPTFEECVRQVQPNSFQICLGRDSKAKDEYLIEDLQGNHVLLIGGTRKGKSCQASQIIDQMTTTHDREHLLISLLDLEDQNCNLFAHLSHVARIQMPNGKLIKSIARSVDEVAAHIGYLVDLMDSRYELSPKERAQLPKILVYIEEFVELKRRLKSKPKVLSQMADDFTSLATRGIKAGIHLMVCAQASYSQEEFREAMGQLIGINMAFCAIPTLARAASFQNNELLKENYLAKKPGQFAIESTMYTTIGIAPDYDVKKKLEAMQEEEETRLSGATGAHYAITEEQERIDGQNRRRLVALNSEGATGAHPARTLPAPDNAPGWEAYTEVIAQLQSEGHNQDPIIEKLWHAKKGSGNQKYLTGREIYRRCNEEIKRRRQVASETTMIDREAM